MKVKIFTLFLCTLFVASAFAQTRPEAVIKKASVAPVIDGDLDDVWAEADTHHIYKPFQAEVPTLGNVGDTYWQALWTADGVWIFLTVTDDEFYPAYIAVSSDHWMYDKPEVYFDVNYILEDDVGASAANSGHHQIARPFQDGLNDGTAIDDPDDIGVVYAYLVTGSNYVAEYFVPFSYLVDKDGIQVDIQEQVGFDITVIDRETGDADRKRAVWANTGTYGDADESWNSMDECGIITFEGAEAPIYADSVHITGGTITKNNGTLQMKAEILPTTASIKTVAWSVENVTGRARINKTSGVLTGILDGDVIVKGVAADGSYKQDTVVVTISNQVVTMSDINLIQNPYFDDVEDDGTATNWGGWGGDGGALMPQVVNGEAVCTPIRVAANNANWQYQYNQMGFSALPDVEYEFSFVAYADAPREGSVDFEGPGDAYNRYGSSTDLRAVGGESEWLFDLTTEPTKYTFDVIFDDMALEIDANNQKVQFMFGTSDTIVYLDSVILINLDDVALITSHTPVTGITVSAAGGATSMITGETLQMSADVLPTDATYPAINWSVENGTGWATIDDAGLLSADSAGEVTVVAGASDDSRVEDTWDITITWPVGIQQQITPTLMVYPNPAVNVLNVSVTSEIATVSIFNSVGMKIEEAIVTGGEHVFDISSYAPGVYIVKSENQVAKFLK